MNFMCQGFRKLSSERHTHYRQTDRGLQNYIPCRFAGSLWKFRWNRKNMVSYHLPKFSKMFAVDCSVH